MSHCNLAQLTKSLPHRSQRISAYKSELLPQAYRIQGRASLEALLEPLSFCKNPATPPPASEAFAASRPSISSRRFVRRLPKLSFIQSHFGFKESRYFCLLSWMFPASPCPPRHLRSSPQCPPTKFQV